jgi:hypothetical protein
MPVTVTDERHPPLDPRWQARVAHVIAQVPEDMVITMKQLAVVAGIQSSYCRAFPPLLRALGQEHKVVKSADPDVGRQWDGETFHGS